MRGSGRRAGGGRGQLLGPRRSLPARDPRPLPHRGGLRGGDAAATPLHGAHAGGLLFRAGSEGVRERRRGGDRGGAVRAGRDVRRRHPRAGRLGCLVLDTAPRDVRPGTALLRPAAALAAGPHGAGRHSLQHPGVVPPARSSGCRGPGARRRRDRPPPRSVAHHLLRTGRGGSAGDRSARGLPPPHRRSLDSPGGGSPERDSARRRRAPLRPGTGTAVPRGPGAPRCRGAHPRAGHAPHRLGRVVLRRLLPRAGRALRCAARRRGGVPAGAACPVFGLRRLAAGTPAGSRPGGTGFLLARAAGRRGTGPGPAPRPRAAGGAEPPGSYRRHRSSVRVDGPPAGAVAQGRRHAVHDPPRGVPAPAVPPRGPGRRGGGLAECRPRPAGGRGAHRPVPQHARAAHRSRGRSDLPRAAGTGPGCRARCLPLSGDSVRAPAGRAPARAPAQPHPDLPGSVQLRVDLGTPPEPPRLGGRSGRARGERLEVRFHALRQRAAGLAPPGPGLQPRPLRARAHARDAAPARDPAGAGGGRAGVARRLVVSGDPRGAAAGPRAAALRRMARGRPRGSLPRRRRAPGPPRGAGRARRGLDLRRAGAPRQPARPLPGLPRRGDGRRRGRLGAPRRPPAPGPDGHAQIRRRLHGPRPGLPDAAPARLPPHRPALRLDLRAGRAAAAVGSGGGGGPLPLPRRSRVVRPLRAARHRPGRTGGAGHRGLHHLHLRLHRRAQGGGGAARSAHALLPLDGRALRPGRDRPLRHALGALARPVAARRVHTGLVRRPDGAARSRPDRRAGLSRGMAERGRGDGAAPHSGPHGDGARLGGRRGRAGTGAARATAGVRGGRPAQEARRGEASAARSGGGMREPVRLDRDAALGLVLPRPPRPRSGSPRQGGAAAGPRHGRLPAPGAEPGGPAGRRRRAGGDPCPQPPPGPGISRRRGAHGGEVPVQPAGGGAGGGGRPGLPDRRPRPVSAGSAGWWRGAGRPRRLPGEAAGLPGRAGGGGGGAGPPPRRARVCRDRAGGPARRAPAGGISGCRRCRASAA